MGKGSGKRKADNDEVYRNNFDLIFRKDKNNERREEDTNTGGDNKGKEGADRYTGGSKE